MLMKFHLIKYYNRVFRLLPFKTFKRMQSQLAIAHNVSFFTNSDMSLSQDNLKLIENKSGLDQGSQRPLCCLTGWYEAHPSHLMKFVDFYLFQQFDVLLVNTKLDTFKSPLAAEKLDNSILKFIQSNPQYNEIILHGFSSAVFAFVRLMWKLDKNPRDLNRDIFLPKVKGQVWDSPGIRPGPGFGYALIQNNRVLRNLVIYSFETFISIFGREMKAKVEQANSTFHNNPLKCPALCFCSEDDELIEFNELVNTLKTWQQNGISVRIKSWTKSAHCSHFRFHNQEYKEELIDFLSSLGLIKPIKSSKL